MHPDSRPGERRLRRWFALHSWSSLLCTLFLFGACLTGLPLVFADELGDALIPMAAYAELPQDTPRISLDRITQSARQAFPKDLITGIFLDPDAPQIRVYMAPSWELSEDPQHMHWLAFDARTGSLLGESANSPAWLPKFNQSLFALHTGLFAGLPGALVFGAMGLLFVLAIISGVVLYGPYMRKLEFGTVRSGKSRRLKWLDLHNLLGIATVVWALVVGLTGALNELTTPLFALWQRTDVQAVIAPWRGKVPPSPDEMGSLQAALQKVLAAQPGMIVTGIDFPGSRYGSSHHYVLWARGNSALTSRLLSPALVDARSGELNAIVTMPWYLRMIEVSRPLHFGDYAGLPLKIVWGLLDLITLVVLGSGLYLWITRRHTHKARLAHILAAHEALEKQESSA
ncbi:PepSY-associated TM helix domain-containing protein [Uliginosibacterium sediminicola]|uniref:PepSY-associated TM helix domain-containing protein n=1 Tax=Uliginosibacterium sediminicola TaxID=2024550 RepID=A0ABU9YVI9_9RHOO